MLHNKISVAVLHSRAQVGRAVAQGASGSGGGSISTRAQTQPNLTSDLCTDTSSHQTPPPSSLHCNRFGLSPALCAECFSSGYPFPWLTTSLSLGFCFSVTCLTNILSTAHCLHSIFLIAPLVNMSHTYTHLFTCLFSSSLECKICEFMTFYSLHVPCIFRSIQHYTLGFHLHI